MTRRIDLHAHTLHSDGTLSAAELVELASEIGLSALAVTDHDITTALPEAREAGQRLGVEILVGCEVSARIPSGIVHVLGYAFDPGDEDLQAFLAGVREDRDRRNVRMLERLAELGLPLGPEEVSRHARGRIVARPHIARAMVERGYAADVREAFQRWLGDRAPGYVPAEMPHPTEAVRAIRAAGGVAVVAHPKQIAIEGRAAYGLFFEQLAEAGLAGIEVDHPSHAPEHRRLFADLARTFDLVPTGGSDFHGSNKPHIALGVGDGTIQVTYDVWERLRERLPR